MGGSRSRRERRGPIERLAGLLMAGIFIHGGWHAYREPGRRPDLAAKLGLPEPEAMVKLNGMTMMVAGSALGLGIRPKLAAAALLAALIPTTLAGHRFWEEESEQGRRSQETQFLKNLGLMGGLLLVLSRRR